MEGDGSAHQCLGPPVSLSFDSEKAGDREVQRTMLELLNQLDGFQPNTQVKVSIAEVLLKMDMGLRGQGTFSVTLLLTALRLAKKSVRVFFVK